jgi:signal transduction histidine kinase
MNYNVLENIQYCRDFVEPLLSIINYSHAVPAISVLLIGLFVFLQNRNLLLGKILLSIASTFSIWTILNYLIWTNYDKGGIIMFAWAPLEIFSVLLFILSFYFIYVYIEKHDIHFSWKIIALLLLSPLLALAATKFNLSSYDIQECIAVENDLYINYVRLLKISISVLTLIYAGFKFLKSDKKIQVGLLSVGVIIFLYTFLIAGYISEQLIDFRYELYSLFGMIVFVGILAYLIVKYKAFSIKLIATQALVVALILLIGAQFLFVKNPVSIVLSGVTLSGMLGFGFLLVRSVKREIEQRLKIEKLAADLKSANDRLRELDKQKSEFLSFASHQLRSPLTAIKGYTSLILEGSFGVLSEQMKGAIDRVFQSTQGMVLMVEDFLNISRIEQGRMKYEMAEININTFVEELTAEQYPVAEKKGLVLKFSPSPSPIMINVDPGKLRQVIANLIDNSIKYTPAGSIEVSVHDLESRARVEITDTGVGISKDEIANLFEKFSRTKNANKVNVIGTGLGLYLAKMIVEAHKGKIWAESKGEGQGSKFIVELPKK